MSFLEYAEAAGVPDLDEFTSCVEETDPVPSIEADMAEVQRLGGIGTPTIIINGWLVHGGANPERLDSIAEALIADVGGNLR